jgi:hypothetical protein
MLVLSLAEMTNLSGARGSPGTDGHRSRMRLALNGKSGSRRKDPGAVLPRANRVVAQPPPHGLVADGSDQAAALWFANDIGGNQPGERKAARRWQLLRERLNLNDEFWGKEPGVSPCTGVPPGPPDVGGRTASVRD